MIGPMQRSLTNKIQQPQERDIHVPGRMRTRNPSKLAAEDTRLTPRGYWNRHYAFSEHYVTRCNIVLIVSLP